MVAKRSRWAKPDIVQAAANLDVSDEVARGSAVRAFCPCRAGWDDFEEHVNLLIRRLRDPSRIVRRHALHVFEDAVRLQSLGDLKYYLDEREENIGEKRACSRYRSMEQRLEARREKRSRRFKKRPQP